MLTEQKRRREYQVKKVFCECAELQAMYNCVIEESPVSLPEDNICE